MQIALIEAEVDKAKSRTSRILDLNQYGIPKYFYVGIAYHASRSGYREPVMHLPTEAPAAGNPTSLKIHPTCSLFAGRWMCSSEKLLRGCTHWKLSQVHSSRLRSGTSAFHRKTPELQTYDTAPSKSSKNFHRVLLFQPFSFQLFKVFGHSSITPFKLQSCAMIVNTSASASNSSSFLIVSLSAGSSTMRPYFGSLPQSLNESWNSRMC